MFRQLKIKWRQFRCEHVHSDETKILNGNNYVTRTCIFCGKSKSYVNGREVSKNGNK